jgi:hypothetical protein
VRFQDVQRFLSSSASTTPSIAIAAMIPPVAGSRYWSANEAGAGVGEAVGAGASFTLMAFSANELK